MPLLGYSLSLSFPAGLFLLHLDLLCYGRIIVVKCLFASSLQHTKLWHTVEFLVTAIRTSRSKMTWLVLAIRYISRGSTCAGLVMHLTLLCGQHFDHAHNGPFLRMLFDVALHRWVLSDAVHEGQMHVQLLSLWIESTSIRERHNS